jgi:hypothetical protein
MELCNTSVLFSVPSLDAKSAAPQGGGGRSTPAETPWKGGLMIAAGVAKSALLNGPVLL